jgi:ADP-ribosylglycohydrolase
MNNKNKYYGLIYGQCIGDALGARYEFLTSEESYKQIKLDMKKNFLPMLGGGFFKTEIGQITDDSEMAIVLLKNLIKYKTYSQKKVAKSYINWYNTKPIDIGKTISKAIYSRKLAKDKNDMIKNSQELNMSSLSNGVLMRCSPLAIYLRNASKKRIIKTIHKESELTHPNPNISSSCIIYVRAIINALKGLSKDKIYEKAIIDAKSNPNVYVILLDSKIRPEPTVAWINSEQVKFINTDSLQFQGYFGVALQNAFYELLNGTSFEESLINIIKRGGDTDTNACIAGALLGSYYGLNKIPKEWINNIKNYKGKRYELNNNDQLDNFIDELLLIK